MAKVDIQLAIVKADIIRKEMNHLARLKVHMQINQIANKITAHIRKKMRSIKKNCSETMVEFADGNAIISISVVLDKCQRELLENSLPSALSELANNYNNTMMMIESSSYKDIQENAVRGTISLNSHIDKLKSLDPHSQVFVCGIKDIPLVSFAPTSLGVEFSQKKGKEQLINETVSGLVTLNSAKVSDEINIPVDTMFDVTIHTLESNHHFNARLSSGQIKSIVILSSRISGELTPKEGKKTQMLKEGFVIEF